MSAAMFYDARKERIMSEADVRKYRPEPKDVYPLTIEKPEYDPLTQGVEPDGKPRPDPQDAYRFVQHMRVFNIIERFQESAKKDATARRWAHETGGISLFRRLPQPEVPPLQMPDDASDELKKELEEAHHQAIEDAKRPRYAETRILTGIDDQNRISTALQGMKDNNIPEVDFKAATGWVRLTLAELQSISGLIAAHVQACFSNERRLHEAIDAAQSLEELNAIDLEEGWPQYRTPAEENAPEVE